MSQENSDLEKLIEKFKKLRFEFLLSIIGLITILTGIFLFLQQGQSSRFGDIEITPATQSSNVQGAEIIIDVSGAVNLPGVYKLPINARVGEAINKAQGLAADADSDWIAKNLNLAAKLTDGAKIYIPKSGEVRGQSVATSGTGQTVASKININLASQSELESLPGIGPVTAQKIISARPYGAIEDLLTKKAVSKSVFEKIKDQISNF